MKFRQELFWDTDPELIDVQKNSQYVIERILDFGNAREVSWLVKTYPAHKIRDVIATSKELHNKSKALWKLVFKAEK